MRKTSDRRGNLARAINLVIDSLLSHIGDAGGKIHHQKIIGDSKFHAKCVREYAEVCYSLAVELEILTRGMANEKTKPKAKAKGVQVGALNNKEAT